MTTDQNAREAAVLHPVFVAALAGAIERHGGLRAFSRATGVDKATASRAARGLPVEMGNAALLRAAVGVCPCCGLAALPLPDDAARVVERLEEGARDIDHDGTPSQVGPSPDELRTTATYIRSQDAALAQRESSLATVTAERDRLREALEPFAVCGDAVSMEPFGTALWQDDETAFNGKCIWLADGETKRLTWGDFRLAARALTGGDGGK